jgi:hypothetical protein
MVQKSLNLKWFLSLKKFNLNYYYYFIIIFSQLSFFSFGELYVLETCNNLFEKLYLL